MAWPLHPRVLGHFLDDTRSEHGSRRPHEDSGMTSIKRLDIGCDEHPLPPARPCPPAPSLPPSTVGLMPPTHRPSPPAPRTTAGQGVTDPSRPTERGPLRVPGAGH